MSTAFAALLWTLAAAIGSLVLAGLILTITLTVMFVRDTKDSR